MEVPQWGPGAEKLMLYF